MSAERVAARLSPGRRIGLVPLSASNALTAVSLARGALRREWPLVLLTYAWHLLRAHGLPSPAAVVRRRTIRLEFEDAATGTWDLISTCIHESDVLWVIPKDADVCPTESFLACLFALVPGCRLALIQTSGDRDWLRGCHGASPAGALPGVGDQSHRIYAARRSQQREHPAVACRVRADAPAPPGVATQFHLLERDGRVIGLTGLYVTDWWPHIAWGGWGAMKRRYAGFHAAAEALTLTEGLARRQSCEWFCIETSGAREYRPARRLYERHGMRIFLTVDDFFRGAGQSAEERRYVVYGKRAQVP